MRRIFLTISLCVVASLPMIWFAALRTDKFPALRGIAQLIYVPENFYEPVVVEQLALSNNGRYKARFDLKLKYAGGYELNVDPVTLPYGSRLALSALLTCDSGKHVFKFSTSHGIIERDINRGLILNLYHFDTSKDFRKGLFLKCDLDADFPQALSPAVVFVRKLSDN